MKGAAVKTHIDTYPEAHAFVKGFVKWNCWQSPTVIVNTTLFSEVVIPFLHMQQQKEFLVFQILPRFSIVELLNFCQTDRKVVISRCGFTLLFQIVNEVNSFSYVYQRHWISSFGKHLSSCRFSAFQVVIFSLICRISLYVLDTCLFLVLFITHITSHSLSCICTSFMVHCDKKVFLFLTQSDFFSRPLWLVSFVSYLRNLSLS